MARYLSILAVLFGMCASPVIAATNYSKTAELPPLRISFSQLQAVLDKAAALLAATNGPIPLSREEMKLRKGELEVVMPGNRLDAGGAKVPDTLDAFEYSASTRDPAPISSLTLSFRDYTRTLSVAGQSPDQVDAVFSVLRDELSMASSFFGGQILRSELEVLGCWGSLVAGIVLLVVWSQTRRHLLFVPILLCTALLAGLLLLPLSEMLAGFSAIRGDAEFAVRYAPQIGLLALVLAAVAILVPLLPLSPSASREAVAAPSKNAPEGPRRKQQRRR